MAILSNEELQSVISKLPAGAARRIVARCNECKQLTWELNQKAAATNPSQYKHVINDVLTPYGVFLTCERPKPLKRNRFGEISHQHWWKLVRMKAVV